MRYSLRTVAAASCRGVWKEGGASSGCSACLRKVLFVNTEYLIKGIALDVVNTNGICVVGMLQKRNTPK